MYTLKIAWHSTATSDEGVCGHTDESTLFIPADQVTVHGVIDGEGNQMDAWDENRAEWFDYRWVEQVNATYSNTQESIDAAFSRMDGRLIQVDRDGKSTWYVATNAWLLGPNGDTIERVAP